MPLLFAQLMKSATTRKYPAYPLPMMTSSSYSACFDGVVGDALGEALLQPARDLFHEPGLLGLPLRHVEARHVGAGALVEVGAAALGDREGVVAGLRQVREELPHLGDDFR